MEEQERNKYDLNFNKLMTGDNEDKLYDDNGYLSVWAVVLILSNIVQNI